MDIYPCYILSPKVSDVGYEKPARFIKDYIAEMDFRYEPNSHLYHENVLNMLLLGCMVVALSRRQEWLW